MSLHEISTSTEKELLKKRVSVHEVNIIPVPKPRSVQVSQSVDDSSKNIEEEDDRIMTEYQASFQAPSDRKTKSKVESDPESSDTSESDNKLNSADNAGYISDSGDVEHYISDSEIEDRVPQIRERQMSVFAPPVAATRKTIYERSASLPTEDLYEVSASSIKLRKQYYEEQIKKEMIEEQLSSEIEDVSSPERKTLTNLIEQKKSGKVKETEPIHDIQDFMEITGKKEVTFEPTHKTDQVEEDQDVTSTQTTETHKEVDLGTLTKRSSLGSEQSSSSDRATKPDSMEVHVDKSEIEDSEKLADLDQDATDLETKSLDSFNAIEMSPKSLNFVEEPIPEITVTLSGMQKRMSEESDEYAPKEDKKKESPINQPEQRVEDIVWEVSVQSHPEGQFNEKVTAIEAAALEKLEDDLSLSTREESDMGSEIHQDHSDSISDKIKTESQSDIERIILDSLHHQKVDPNEAKVIASALIEEIESEIQRREALTPTSTSGSVNISDYLKYLAETKGLDEREVELVESVLARRQRELNKLTRDDTQASSIEITDEDLRYSGTEIDSSNILEQQISQLKAEKVDEMKPLSFYDRVDEKKVEETHSSKDYETYDAGVITGHKTDIHTKTFEGVKGEKSEYKETIFEEDETISESTSQENQSVETRVGASVIEKTHKITDDSKIDELIQSDVSVNQEKDIKITSKSSQIESDDSITHKTEDESIRSDATKSKIIHEVDISETKDHEDTVLKGKISFDDSLKKEASTKTQVMSQIRDLEGGGVLEKSEKSEEERNKIERKEESAREKKEVTTTKDANKTIEQKRTSSITTKVDVLHESARGITETFESTYTVPSDKLMKKQEIERTSSSDSKSSIDSGKSPEDQFSTCSSGRKGDSDTSKIAEKPEVLLRKATANSQKAERKSGIDFETYSSSGESHYQSFELDSGKSRPCSSDVEGLVAAGSSEYESALTSQDFSARSHTEYHTAVSSLSSKESMKSLDSESSGHLGSIEVSELSETLVPTASDSEGDILDCSDQPLQDDQWNEIIEKEPESRMKRSQEMTFQPEPKILVGSPQIDETDRRLEDGSVLSVSLSSTTSASEPRTVIELSRADSERGGSMTVSGTSDQLSMQGSLDSLVFHPTPTTTEMSTSTGVPDPNLKVESITITTSTVEGDGIRNVGTQVISEGQVKTEVEIMGNGKITGEVKKKGHRRQESTSFVLPAALIKTELDQKIQSDLTESDKYQIELSHKEVSSDEKKDIDESYETEADQGFHKDVREGKYHESEEDAKVLSPQSRTIRDDLHLHKELEKRDSHGKSSSASSSFEEAEAEAAFNMVAHISPAHKMKQICPILEDEDAEKHELETRERAQKELERRKAQIRDQSPGSIPDIKVTQHITPLVDRNFHYPDLELEEAERRLEKQKQETPQTPSSKSSEDTDQGREYILEDSGISIPEESATDSKSTVLEKTVEEEEGTDSPNSDSFEMLEKPDLIDDFVVIEEVAREAKEFDTEGQSVSIHQKSKRKSSKKHDEEVEAYLTKSAPTPLTKMTDVKFYPEGSSSDELGFEFEDSPPINDGGTASSYDKELEANKQWIEQQFQGDQAAKIAAGYDYEMEFERGPLEDIKEEDINDFDPNSSRIGSLGSQKESGGSLGSVKDSYSSTPEYDVLAGRKYFTRSGEHDDVSMSSLQEFETLERAMSLENRRALQGSQDSSSNGSFKTRYYANKTAQGDDVSVSSLKEFEGLEMACIAAHGVEVKAKEEEAMLAQIEEGQESLASESESCETVTDKKLIPESDDEDYEKRMFEIDEIIKQAQTNVERFVELKEGEKTESLGRGDSIEEVSKVPDLDLDAPLLRGAKVQWKENDDVMITSTDSIEAAKVTKDSRHDSTDSLDQKTGADIMSASTDSIEFQSKKTEPINLLSDSIEVKDNPCGGSSMVCSDSLELKPGDLKDYMLGSTDSLDPTSSTATHATYQYETDSVFSGSCTSGGSNTMVSSSDNMDPLLAQNFDLAAAARQVFYDQESGQRVEYLGETGQPYVTEIIEPCEDDDSFSHTIHRRIEMPPDVRKVTFYGPDAEEKLKEYMKHFDEGEQVEEFEEVDAEGNVHKRRVVQKRVILKDDLLKTNQLTKDTTAGLLFISYFSTSIAL